MLIREIIAAIRCIVIFCFNWASYIAIPILTNIMIKKETRIEKNISDRQRDDIMQLSPFHCFCCCSFISSFLLILQLSPTFNKLKNVTYLHIMILTLFVASIFIGCIRAIYEQADNRHALGRASSEFCWRFERTAWEGWYTLWLHLGWTSQSDIQQWQSLTWVQQCSWGINLLIAYWLWSFKVDYGSVAAYFST